MSEPTTPGAGEEQHERCACGCHAPVCTPSCPACAAVVPPTETAPACIDCGGSGVTVQGWTDKNGYPEDQYGPCARCSEPTPSAPAAVGGGLSKAERSWGITRENGQTVYAESDVERILAARERARDAAVEQVARAREIAEEVDQETSERTNRFRDQLAAGGTEAALAWASVTAAHREGLARIRAALRGDQA